jgi:hypothetical protein
MKHNKGKKMKKCYINEITRPNDDGMVTIELSIVGHVSAVTVHGSGYNEAVDRAVVIRDAFNGQKK